MRNAFGFLLSAFVAANVLAQVPEPATAKALSSHNTGMNRSFEEVAKDIDDVRWYFRVGDVAAAIPCRLPPGGHHFNRIDTALAKESRKEIYEFLARNLK